MATLNLGVSSTFGGPILNPIILDELFSFFKLTMQNHCQVTMLPPHYYNPTTRLWERIDFNAILNHCMSQLFILTKMCMFMGSVGDKHTFSNLAFIKSKLQNWLGPHLDLVVQMYVQKLHPGHFPILHSMWLE